MINPAIDPTMLNSLSLSPAAPSSTAPPFADAPPSFRYELVAQRGAARAGRLHTPHGMIDTPAFVAVGTLATVKAMTAEALLAAGCQVLFANTYHLYLRPGADVVAGLGGLHRFMDWPGPILTDSGGFQVFSLGAGLQHGVGKIASMFPDEDRPAAARGSSATSSSVARSLPADRARPRTSAQSMVQVTEDGVSFRSHLDGGKHQLTPESSIELQRQLGADIVLAFDECTSPLHDYAYTRKAMERTHRWAERSLAAFRGSAPLHGYPQALYGIIQGGAYDDLRDESVAAISELPFDGIAVGGSLGGSRADMARVLQRTVPALDAARPRHLLGIGEPADVFTVAEHGFDTFDCVAPTRMARNAALLAPRDDDGRPLAKQRRNLRNARYRRDERPVWAECGCYTCRHHSRAYLHHLFSSRELLAHVLATTHNLYVMNRLTAEVRAAIVAGTLNELRAGWLGPPDRGTIGGHE